MSGTKERHREACALFAEIVDLDREARRSRVAAIASENPSLAREVEAMLAADDGSLGSVDALHRAIETAITPVLPEVDLLIGTHVGRYSIDRLIAAGGMGRVYEARQDSPNRVVAIKLLDTRIVSRAALSRFRHEAEVMAQLVHPGIAQIYEAGTQREMAGTAPWYAMELVTNAVTIIDVARERQLDVRARIELFLRVAEAVGYGHSRGIIHRDLKPSNVLVDREAPTLAPKIIDFGIARSIDSDITLATQRTEVGQIVGTLQYMSPEQLAADPRAIDVRSDVYALGLLLYELLTGRSAFDVGALPVHEALRVLNDYTPRRMKDVVPALKTILSGDLETIVAKAMDRDIGRRYATVAELIQDLRRYLAHEPISARPPSAMYTLRLFARRHRAMVWGAAATVAMLVLGLIGTGIGLIRAQNSERATEIARDNAEFDAYVANVMAAEAAMRTHDIKLARERLDAAPKKLRGWEWRHLNARIDRSIAKATFDFSRPQLIEYSPDGRALVVGDTRGLLRVIDAETLRELWTHQGNSQVAGVTFSSAGTRMAVRFDHSGLFVFDWSTHEIVAQHETAPARMRFVDDDTVLMYGRGGTIERWRLRANSTELVMNAASVDPSLEGWDLVAVSPNGEWMLLSRVGDIVLVRTRDGAVDHSFKADWPATNGPVWWHATFSPDSQSLALEIASHVIIVRDLTTGVEHRTYVEYGQISLIAWTLSEHAIIIGDEHGILTVRDATTLQTIRHMFGHALATTGIAVRGNVVSGPRFASIDVMGTIRLWAPETFDLIRHQTNRAWVYAVAFAPDSSWFVAASGENPSDDPMVAAYETRSGRQIWASPPAEKPMIVWSVDVSWDGKRVLHEGETGRSSQVRDASSGALVSEFSNAAPFEYQGFSRLRPRAQEYFTKGTNARLLRSLADGHVIRVFSMEHYNESAVSPDGQLLAISPRPGTGIEIYQVDDGSTITRVDTPATVWSMEFSPDQHHLAARCNDGIIYLWSTSTWALDRTWPTDSSWGEQITFEPGGRLLGRVVGGIRVWDIQRGREILTLPTLGDPASKLVVSPDGSWLGVGCVGGSVLLFDAPLAAPK